MFIIFALYERKNDKRKDVSVLDLLCSCSLGDQVARIELRLQLSR